MRKLVLIAVLACTACNAAPAPSNTAGADPVDITGTVTVALPAEAASPFSGAAGALVGQNCSACHSLEMIANQPPLDARKWQATVDKMRTVYKAEIPAGEDDALVAALIEVQAEQRKPR